MIYLYNVMTKQTKGKLVNFRVRDDFKREFEVVAELRGTTLSGLIHQLLVKAVREEKEREPKAFEIKTDDLEGKELVTKSPKKIPLIIDKDEVKQVA